MPDVMLLNDDCISAMQQFAESSVDLIVTDPPYNLGGFVKKKKYKSCWNA